MNTINYNPSFCGATQIFQKRIFQNKTTFFQIANDATSGYVGSLPNEMIKDIIRLSSTVKEKEFLIKFIMDSFSNTADFISKKIDAERENPLTVAFYRLYAMFKKKKINDFQYKYEPPCTPEEKTKIAVSASSILTKALRKAKILKKGENIDLTYIGEGSYKNVFSLKFPQRTGYTPKVISVFKPIPKEYLEIEDKLLHGILPELNMFAYINKQNQKNSPFIRNYFGSMTNDFILSEDANYLEPAEELSEEIFKKMNLIHWDLNPENIVNGWIIDLGGLKMRNPYRAKSQGYKS